MSKNCKLCWILNENPLLPYCRSCVYEVKPYETVKTKIKQVSDKRKTRILNWGSEKDMFRKLIIEKQDQFWNLTCEISWFQFHISEAKPWCFAHILWKKDFPYLRLFPNNICIVRSPTEHQLVDKYVTWNKLEIEKKILKGERINILDYAK